MNPYAPPAEGSTADIAKRAQQWSIRTRLKLFVGFAITSIFLTFGFFHGFVVLCWGDLQGAHVQVPSREATGRSGCPRSDSLIYRLENGLHNGLFPFIVIQLCPFCIPNHQKILVGR